MAQDLRKLFKEERKLGHTDQLAGGHDLRFAERLEKELPAPKETHRFLWMKMAAVFIIAFGCGLFAYKYVSPEQAVPVAVEQQTETSNPGNIQEVEEVQPVYLSDVSPEYKKVEDYYLANIHAELAQLNVNQDNKELVDSFMDQLGQLEKEYKKLNEELNDTGVNEQTLSSLINNLELRLKLLNKLKTKLAQIKTSSVSQMQENQI